MVWTQAGHVRRMVAGGYSGQDGKSILAQRASIAVGLQIRRIRCRRVLKRRTRRLGIAIGMTLHYRHMYLYLQCPVQLKTIKKSMSGDTVPSPTQLGMVEADDPDFSRSCPKHAQCAHMPVDSSSELGQDISISAHRFKPCCAQFRVS